MPTTLVDVRYFVSPEFAMRTRGERKPIEGVGSMGDSDATRRLNDEDFKLSNRLCVMCFN